MNTTCPACKKETTIPNYVIKDATDLFVDILYATKCCKASIQITPYVSVSIKEYHGREKMDDYDTVFKK